MSLQESDSQTRTYGAKLEFRGVLGTDESYRFKEFHRNENGAIIIPFPWELVFLGDDEALCRRLRRKHQNFNNSTEDLTNQIQNSHQE